MSFMLPRAVRYAESDNGTIYVTYLISPGNEATYAQAIAPTMYPGGVWPTGATTDTYYPPTSPVAFNQTGITVITEGPGIVPQGINIAAKVKNLIADRWGRVWIAYSNDSMYLAHSAPLPGAIILGHRAIGGSHFYYCTSNSILTGSAPTPGYEGSPWEQIPGLIPVTADSSTPNQWYEMTDEDFIPKTPTHVLYNSPVDSSANWDNEQPTQVAEYEAMPEPTSPVYSAFQTNVTPPTVTEPDHPLANDVAGLSVASWDNDATIYPVSIPTPSKPEPVSPVDAIEFDIGFRYVKDVFSRAWVYNADGTGFLLKYEYDPDPDTTVVAWGEVRIHDAWYHRMSDFSMLRRGEDDKIDEENRLHSYTYVYDVPANAPTEFPTIPGDIDLLFGGLDLDSTFTEEYINDTLLRFTLEGPMVYPGATGLPIPGNTEVSVGILTDAVLTKLPEVEIPALNPPAIEPTPTLIKEPSPEQKELTEGSFQLDPLAEVVFTNPYDTAEFNKLLDPAVAVDTIATIPTEQSIAVLLEDNADVAALALELDITVAELIADLTSNLPNGVDIVKLMSELTLEDLTSFLNPALESIELLDIDNIIATISTASDIASGLPSFEPTAPTAANVGGIATQPITDIVDAAIGVNNAVDSVGTPQPLNDYVTDVLSPTMTAETNSDILDVIDLSTQPGAEHILDLIRHNGPDAVDTMMDDTGMLVTDPLIVSLEVRPIEVLESIIVLLGVEAVRSTLKLIDTLSLDVVNQVIHYDELLNGDGLELLLIASSFPSVVIVRRSLELVVDPLVDPGNLIILNEYVTKHDLTAVNDMLVLIHDAGILIPAIFLLNSFNNMRMTNIAEDELIWVVNRLTIAGALLYVESRILRGVDWVTRVVDVIDFDSNNTIQLNRVNDVDPDRVVAAKHAVDQVMDTRATRLTTSLSVPPELDINMILGGNNFVLVDKLRNVLRSVDVGDMNALVDDYVNNGFTAVTPESVHARIVALGLPIPVISEAPLVELLVLIDQSNIGTVKSIVPLLDLIKDPVLLDALRDIPTAVTNDINVIKALPVDTVKAVAEALTASNPVSMLAPATGPLDTELKAAVIPVLVDKLAAAGELALVYDILTGYNTPGGCDYKRLVLDKFMENYSDGGDAKKIVDLLILICPEVLRYGASKVDHFPFRLATPELLTVLQQDYRTAALATVQLQYG